MLQRGRHPEALSIKTGGEAPGGISEPFLVHKVFVDAQLVGNRRNSAAVRLNISDYSSSVSVFARWYTLNLPDTIVLIHDSRSLDCSNTIIMRIQLFICVLFIIYSCKEGEQKQPASTNDTNGSVVANSNVKPEEKAGAANLAVADTGQTWFRVIITRNDSAFMDYAGSWPVFLLSNNSATLQLSRSREMMSVTDMVTIYMNGMPTGKTPIVLNNNEKGTASMILSPVADGAYGLPIMPTEGVLNITKNVDSVVSGNFEGKGVDGNNDRYAFKGYFLNVKINPYK